jgi:hypothetical protein
MHSYHPRGYHQPALSPVLIFPYYRWLCEPHLPMMSVTAARHGVTNVLVRYWCWQCHLVLIYWFLPFIVHDLCKCLPISLILTGFDAGYCHIYYATGCYRHASAIYIKLQTLIPVLHHTINRGDFYKTTTATEATWHYWSYLFFPDVCVHPGTLSGQMGWRHHRTPLGDSEREM